MIATCGAARTRGKTEYLAGKCRVDGQCGFAGNTSLRDLHQKCTREMDDYVGYHTNEFDLCRKEQKAFESKCSLE
ncbi:hypothetical protein RJT34_17110 [Clitoria ternatea]|uniref:Uncharacterized protein n=1 Tax=Clitoria ternatea TaxID=43366 RepID=A0AAN9JAH7_CLITE